MTEESQRFDLTLALTEAVTEEAGLILVWLEASPIPIPQREVADPAALLAFIRARMAAASLPA
jgi:hypothetical protein